MSGFREFDIARPNYSDTLKVRVYKTEKCMRNGVAKNNKLFGYKPIAHDYGAVWTSVPTAKCKYTKGRARPVMFGIMSFYEGGLTTDLIAHECLHAAFSHDWYVNNFTGDYRHVFNGEDYEERLILYFQWLFANVLHTLKEAGYKVAVSGKKKQ